MASAVAEILKRLNGLSEVGLDDLEPVMQSLQRDPTPNLRATICTRIFHGDPTAKVSLEDLGRLLSIASPKPPRRGSAPPAPIRTPPPSLPPSSPIGTPLQVPKLTGSLFSHPTPPLDPEPPANSNSNSQPPQLLSGKQKLLRSPSFTRILPGMRSKELQIEESVGERFDKLANGGHSITSDQLTDKFRFLVGVTELSDAEVRAIVPMFCCEQVITREQFMEAARDFANDILKELPNRNPLIGSPIMSPRGLPAEKLDLLVKNISSSPSISSSISSSSSSSSEPQQQQRYGDKTPEKVLTPRMRRLIPSLQATPSSESLIPRHVEPSSFGTDDSSTPLSRRALHFDDTHLNHHHNNRVISAEQAECAEQAIPNDAILLETVRQQSEQIGQLQTSLKQQEAAAEKENTEQRVHIERLEQDLEALGALQAKTERRAQTLEEDIKALRSENSGLSVELTSKTKAVQALDERVKSMHQEILAQQLFAQQAEGPEEAKESVAEVRLRSKVLDLEQELKVADADRQLLQDDLERQAEKSRFLLVKIRDLESSLQEVQEAREAERMAVFLDTPLAEEPSLFDELNETDSLQAAQQLRQVMGVDSMPPSPNRGPHRRSDSIALLPTESASSPQPRPHRRSDSVTLPRNVDSPLLHPGLAAGALPDHDRSTLQHILQVEREERAAQISGLMDHLSVVKGQLQSAQLSLHALRASQLQASNDCGDPQDAAAVSAVAERREVKKSAATLTASAVLVFIFIAMLLSSSTVFVWLETIVSAFCAHLNPLGYPPHRFVAH